MSASAAPGVRARGLALLLLLAAPVAAPAQEAQVDSARMLHVLGALAHDSMGGRRLGSPESLRARQLLVRELERRGIEPLGADYLQHFSVPSRGGAPRQGTNVLGVIRGTVAPGRYIVVSAHYDHLGTRDGRIYNGADDNASGTAAALEVASSLRARPPAHSVIIALFDGEEAGLRGARAFTDAPPVPLAAIALNINLDMVGRNDAGELYVAGTHPYPQLRAIVDAVRARSEVILRMGHDSGGGMANWTAASDHAAFHERGIPFLYFGVEDHVDYHRESDDAERIQAGFFVRATRTIIAAVRAADGWLERER